MRIRNWTLRTKLIALTVVLVAATSVVIGGVAFLVLRNAVSQQFDARLSSDAQAVAHMSNNAGGQDYGLAIGQVVGFVDNSGTFVAGRVTSLSTDGIKNLPAEDTAVMERLASQPGPVDARLGSYGEYRFVTVPRFGSAMVVGEPLTTLEQQIAENLATIALVVVAAIILSALLGAFVLRRALRPLRRVAAVASAVAEMPLERGEVQLAQRVPGVDTDPHTEVGQVGSALNALLDSVETALVVRQASEEKVRAFVADASHELRTPLASIRGYAELTRRFGGDLSDTVQHNIARIESESQRMTSLVEDLLLLARLDAERELDSTEVDLSRLLLDVLSDAHAAGPDHAWDIDLPPEPVVVYGDDAKLHQVFTNLLANARVHTPAGTRVSIELAEADADSAVVIVRDEGPGIPAELQPKLFERFARGDSSRTRSTGSTGLGLSIVQAVVAAHHGEVAVTSKPGSTVFTVRLPLHQPARREPVAA